MRPDEVLKLAENGDSEAQYEMGINYCYGLDVPKDFGEALRMSADNGNHDAQIRLISLLAELGDKCYDAGKYEDAISWYTQCAETGYAYVPRKLGDMCLEGIGTKADPVKALQWYTKAAERGDVKAMFSLGDMYFSGIGTHENKCAAYLWYYVCFLTLSDIYDITGSAEDKLRKTEGFLTPDERAEAISEAGAKYDEIIIGIGRNARKYKHAMKKSKGE